MDPMGFLLLLLLAGLLGYVMYTVQKPPPRPEPVQCALCRLFCAQGQLTLVKLTSGPKPASGKVCVKCRRNNRLTSI